MMARVAAAKVIAAVHGGRSLSAELPMALQQVPSRDRPLVQELCYGVLRWFPRLEALAARLLSRKLKARDRDVQALILAGLYQLLHMRLAAHAAVDETVKAARALGKPWAAGLVNAVLRGFLRERERLTEELDRGDEAVALAHPRWLYERLRADWPQEYRAVLEANNAHPPMVLRVNRLKTERPDYLRRLEEEGHRAQPAPYTEDGVVLERPVDVTNLPGFSEGWVSVQDGAAQLAAPLLGAQPGARVLDACAAPGGKAGHILEREPSVELTALDMDGARLLRVQENLARLGLSACSVQGDATAPAGWWDGRPYAAILLDAPCSATGVIRRHPDIKLLRRAEDIAALAEVQQRILEALWALLEPGGHVLLYATCSVLREENEQQIARFLAAHPDARERSVEAPWGRACRHGRQILPGEAGMDGFYFALLEKA
jgi:16S rRNA (cytosine967-C5)-methyltransferase